MNAGRDQVRAMRQAHANANRSGDVWIVWFSSGVWWVERETTGPDVSRVGGVRIVPERDGRRGQ